MNNLQKIISIHSQLITILERILSKVDVLRITDSSLTSELQSLQQNIELQLYELRTERSRLRLLDKYGEKVGKLSPKLQPFKLLPDVKDFRIQFKGKDPIFKKFGLEKNLKPKLTFTPYTNRKMNRYALWQINRLNNSLLEPRKFWRIAESILRRSVVFGLISLQMILPLWHRKYPLWLVKQYYREFEDIRKTSGIKPIDFKRVYIDKIPASKGKRGLGVPSIPWRLYLNLWNRLLMIYLQPRISTNQHGFLYQKGTMTAWKELLLIIMSKPKSLYEYDLKNCFNQIRISKMINLLKEAGLPTHLLLELRNLNSSAPKLPAVEELDERQAKIKAQHQKDLDAIRAHGRLSEAEIQTFMDAWLRKDVTPNYDFRREGDKIIYEPNKSNMAEPERDQGLPQGSPTSPLLTIFTLNDSYLGQQAGTKYADDGVVKDATRTDIPKLNSKEHGIEINESKSGWICEDYQWLKPISFLGMLFDPTTNSFRSNTHKGSKLYMDKWPLLSELKQTQILGNMMRQTSDRDKIPYLIRKGMSWTDFATSHVLGWLTSRMYIGTWSDAEFEQNFNLTCKQGSWTQLYKERQSNIGLRAYGLVDKHELNIFNSSSFAIGYFRNWVTSDRIINEKRNSKSKVC